ncbi:MAG: hypothetical protein H0X30_15395 [Anaerolineae bacterium]|nr:hypothetical protein [Anaerolineae bacterium]
MVLLPSVIARPFGARRQAIVSFGDTHMVIGSALITDTVTGLTQPSDFLLASLATDCTFACQDAAAELDILLNSLTTTTRWKIAEHREIIVRLGLSGPTELQAQQLIDCIKAKASMYKLLSQIIPITFEVFS